MIHTVTCAKFHELRQEACHCSSSPNSKAQDLGELNSTQRRKPNNQGHCCGRASEKLSPAQAHSAFAFGLRFRSTQALRGLEDTDLCEWGEFYPLSLQVYLRTLNSNVSIFLKPSQSHPEIMCDLLSGHHLTQSSWHRKYILTSTF